MNHITYSLGSGSCHKQVVTARTLFSVRPTDPPSSPPPTSPLPPIPSTANLREQRTSSVADSGQTSRPPPRPPRPHGSLSNIKSRVITSPEPNRRNRVSELPAQIYRSTVSCQETLGNISAVQTSAITIQRNPNRLLDPTAPASSTFSEEVWSALPRLFRSTPQECLERDKDPPAGKEQMRAWQAHHHSPSKESGGRRKTSTRKPIARTALFIPATPPNEKAIINRRCTPGHDSLSGEAQSKYLSSKMTSDFRVQDKPLATLIEQGKSEVLEVQGLAGQRRSIVNGGRTSGLGHHRRRTERSSRIIPGETITHYHGFLEFATLSQQEGRQLEGHKQDRANVPQLDTRASEEEMAFASLPYAHTLHNDGPQLNTVTRIHHVRGNHYLNDLVAEDTTMHRQHSKQGRFRSIDPEVGEQPRPQTEEEAKQAARTKILWVTATFAMVLIATGGILGGIISKLMGLGRITPV